MACIRKRRNKWIVDYYLCGRRKNPSFDTKAEAEAFKRELKIRDIDNQIGFVQIEILTLDQAIQQYLETITVRKEPRTAEVDVQALGKFGRFFQGAVVTNIQLQHLEKYQIELTNDGLKASSVNRKFNVIRHFFRKCSEWKYCRENPTVNLAKLKEDIVIRTPLSLDHLNDLLKSLPIWASRAFFFVAKTGARRGQVCSLRWNDVDFDRNCVRVSTKKGGKQTRVNELPMTYGLRHLLMEIWNERQQNNSDSSFVFLNRDGNPIIPSTFTRVVIEVGKNLNIENAGIHIVRHTVLTDLSVHNQSGSLIQKVAGHSSLVTSQKYLHHNSSDVRSAMEKLEEEKPVTIPFRKNLMVANGGRI